MPLVYGPLFNDEYSMSFDGTDDFVDCGNVLDKNKSTPFSISLWTNIPATTVNNIPISKIEDRGGAIWEVGYKFNFNNQLFFVFNLDSHFSHSMYVRDNNYWGPSQGLTNGWHHIVGTYDGTGSETGMTLYVDGYDVSYYRSNNGTPSSDFNNSGSLYIGGMNYSGTPASSFGGKVDEAAIFSYELTPAQVLTIYGGIRPSSLGNPVPNWVSYPTWNDGTGKPNNVGNLPIPPIAWYRMGDNGVFKYPQWLLPENSNKDNVSNYSMSFDGTDDYVNCGNDASLQMTADVTISAWIKTSTTSTQQQIVTRGLDWVMNGFALFVRTNNQVAIMLSNSGYPYATSSTSVTDGNWHHIVGVRDSSGGAGSLKIYVDGLEDGDEDGGTDAMANGEEVWIGSGTNGGSPFEGLINDVSIFNSALSAGEVTAIWNNGVPSDLSGESHLVGYWRLGDMAYSGGTGDIWIIPDSSGNGNDGSSVNIPLSGRTGNAPGSTNNALSMEMDINSRTTDVPT